MFSRIWAYLKALFTTTADQAMDPKIVAERIVDVASGDIALATGAHLVVGPPAAPPPLATRIRRRLGRLVRGFGV